MNAKAKQVSVPCAFTFGSKKGFVTPKRKHAARIHMRPEFASKKRKELEELRLFRRDAQRLAKFDSEMEKMKIAKEAVRVSMDLISAEEMDSDDSEYDVVEMGQPGVKLSRVARQKLMKQRRRSGNTLSKLEASENRYLPDGATNICPPQYMKLPHWGKYWSDYSSMFEYYRNQPDEDGNYPDGYELPNCSNKVIMSAMKYVDKHLPKALHRKYMLAVGWLMDMALADFWGVELKDVRWNHMVYKRGAMAILIGDHDWDSDEGSSYPTFNRTARHKPDASCSSGVISDDE